MTTEERTYLEGHISIRAGLEAGSRQIYALYVRERKRDRTTRYIMRLAQSQDVPISRLPAGEIDKMAGGKTHGGLLAEVGSRRMCTLTELLPAAASEDADSSARDVSGNVESSTDSAPFIVMIDGVEDPYNFGYAVRVLYAAGADGLVVRPRNWTTAAATVARASAGATEYIPIAVAETTLDAAAFFRDRGLLVACAAKDRSVPIYDVDLTPPLFLLIGGEKRGITRSFADQADIRIQIPYRSGFQQSLGTTSATAILAYEVMRQRRL